MLTPRENALTALNHEVPERIVDMMADGNGLGTYLICERGQATPDRPFGGDGPDWFNVQWKYVESSKAPMVDPDTPPVMTDITKWGEQVKFPNLEEVDFAGEAKKDLASPKYDPDKLNVVGIMNGPFERLHALMGFEEALMAMMIEPEATLEFFHAIIDYKLDLIDRLLAVYPVDVIEFHDDWGHQRNAFFSVDMWERLLRDPIVRVVEHCRDKNVHLQIHSCGKVESLIPSMVEAGIDHWSSCQSVNDMPRLVHEFGDRLTFFGGMDVDEAKRPGITPEEIYKIASARIDDICRGGAVFPLGNSSINGYGAIVSKIINEKKDFFKDPRNRMLP